MLTSWKSAALAAVAIGAMSPMAMADHARYELKRITAGPRSDSYVYVRAHRSESGERPYALTGADRERRERNWPTPLHLKGPRNNY